MAARLPGRGLGASGGGAPRWRSSWLPCQGALGAAGAPAPGAGRRPGAPSVARQPTFKSAPEPETTGPAAPPEDAAWPGPACSQPQGPGSPSPRPGQTGPWPTGRHSGWHRALRPPGPGPCVPTKGKGGISACCRQARVLPWPLSPQRKTSALRRITGAKDPVT